MERTPQNIAAAKLYFSQEGSKTVQLLKGEIPGTAVFHHALDRGDAYQAPADPYQLKIFFVIKGHVVFTAGGDDYPVEKKAAFVPYPGQETAIRAQKPASILEIHWQLTEDDQGFMKDSPTQYPFLQIYEDCEQYRETFKSPRSISRSIIGHHAMPRFAMGSNESYGPDRVEPHEHPLLDQYFFSFPENDIDLLIDGERIPYGGDTLLHIPLGSDHGVDIAPGKKMHYLWIDFLIDPGAIAYLDNVHKPTGVKQSFDDSHQITSGSSCPHDGRAVKP